MKKALEDVETKYSDIEKLALTLFMLAKKLRPYFQTQIIIVVTLYPLCVVLHNPNMVGWLIKRYVALSAFHIIYQPRISVKAQALVDFIVELTLSEQIKG